MNHGAWKTLSLSRCVKFISGGTPRKSRSEYWDGDIPWVSSGEMTERRIYDTTLHVSEQGALDGSKLVPTNTVLVVVRGMSLANEFRVAITQRPATFNQDIKALHCINGVTPEYLFYALLAKRETIRDLASEASHGTKRLESDVLSAVEIAVPPTITLQERIVDILSAYDDLIENNRRRMALLEDAARQLYREWFVRRRFPGHEHTPIKDGLPEGWKQKPLSELTSFLKRGIAPHYDDDAPGLVINQKCIRDGRLNLNLARHQNREFKPERQIQLGDVLVNSTGEGTLGRIAQVKTTVENCTVDTHVTIVRPHADLPLHYFGLAVMEWEPRFSTMGRGATNQTELSPDAIGETQIVIPSRTLSDEYEAFAEPIFRQVTNLDAQNNSLRASRDLLLPRLMSGEIPV